MKSQFAAFLAWARKVRKAEWVVINDRLIRTPCNKRQSDGRMIPFDCPLSFGSDFSLNAVVSACYDHGFSWSGLPLSIEMAADKPTHTLRKKLERLCRIKPEES